MEQCLLPKFLMLVNERHEDALTPCSCGCCPSFGFAYLFWGKIRCACCGPVMKSMCDIVRTTDALWAPKLPRVLYCKSPLASIHRSIFHIIPKQLTTAAKALFCDPHKFCSQNVWKHAHDIERTSMAVGPCPYGRDS